MSDFKETIIKECLDVLHKEEVKEEFKQLMRPLIDMSVSYTHLTLPTKRIV